MPGYEPHPSVVCTVLEDGAVLLHLDTKYYYSLNDTGLKVWLLLEDGHTTPADDLAAGSTDPTGTIAAVTAFLKEMEAERLIQPAGNSTAPSAGTPVAPPGGGDWPAPRLTRHEIPLNQILNNPFDPCVPLAE